GLVGAEIAMAATIDPVRPAFPGDILPRRFSRLRGALRAGRTLRWRPPARAGQRPGNPHYVGSGVGDLVVQALCRQGSVQGESRRRQCRHGGRERMRPLFGAALGLTLLGGIAGSGPLWPPQWLTCEG